MAKPRTFRHQCDTHGEFTAGGPRAKCPACKAPQTEGPGKPRREARARTKAQPRPAGNGNIVFTVNFSRYPKLHERLTALATEQYRTPEMQLLFMLNQEFERIEGKIPAPAGAEVADGKTESYGTRGVPTI